MTRMRLKASLALWKRRVVSRTEQVRRAAAALEHAREKNIHPRGHLVAIAARLREKLAEAEAMVARRERQLRRSGPQRTSPNGVLFISRREGVRQYAYNDSVNNATFGIGHLLHLGPVTRADQVKWGTPRFPRPMALVNRVFRRDVKKYEAAVRNAVDRRLETYEFDACVSLCLNIGAAGFARSSVARLAKAGAMQDAADAFLLWDNPPELIGRRRLERTLFLTGEYQ
jgi:lysozyme